MSNIFQSTHFQPPVHRQFCCTKKNLGIDLLSPGTLQLNGSRTNQCHHFPEVDIRLGVSRTLYINQSLNLTDLPNLIYIVCFPSKVMNRLNIWVFRTISKELNILYITCHSLVLHHGFGSSHHRICSCGLRSGQVSG